MATQSEDALIHSDALFAEVLNRSNRRLILAFLSIFLLANVATIAIKLSGKGSKYLTFESIIIEFLVIAVILGLTFLFELKTKGKIISAYISITGVMMCIWVFQFIIYGASELSAIHYITLALSIFYFDWKASLYAFILVLLSQTLLFVFRPELIPVGPSSNIIVRYLTFLWVGISATVGAQATKRILALAIHKNQEACMNADSLKHVAREVSGSIQVFNDQADDLKKVTGVLDNISRDQAASLEEVSASIEELSASSESLNAVSKRLYNEVSDSVGAVNELKNVNDRVVENNQRINMTLGEIADFSLMSTQKMKHTQDQFATLKEKSSEMSNFIQIINDIADKVNLLSLNAAIEAARAGDSGRGFAVVADEISKLADATTSNSKEIANIINENHVLIDGSSVTIEESSININRLNDSVQRIREELGQVGTLVQDVDRTIRTITNMNAKVHEISKLIENSTTEQQASTGEINKTTFHISDGSQEIVASSMKITDALSEIKQIALNLGRLSESMVIE
jgi:methyl-accepting chemotaxis protein